MKRKLGAVVLVVALALSLGLMPAASVGASPGPGIVGLWHLDDGTGSIASDSSGNANNGTLSGGKFGNALDFDGTDDYVSVPDSASLRSMTDITIEAWIKADATQPDTYSTIVRRDAHPGATTRTLYDLDLVNGYLRLAFIGSGGGLTIATSTTTDLRDGQWHHVAVVRDATAGKAYGYVDGTKEIDVADGTSGNFVSSPSTPLYIGDWSLDTTSRRFSGLIDEVRISDVARTSFALTSPPVADTDTVALWRLDESVDSTAEDEANNNDGTIYGASWAGPTWTSGMSGDALSFDGTGDYVDVGGAVDNSITTALTLEAWIKYSNADKNRDGGIISNDLTWITKKGYDFFLENGKLGIDVGNGSVVGRVLYTMPAPDPVDPDWRHVAATWDGITVTLYVDGSSVGTTALSGTYSDPGKATWVGQINSHLSAYLYPLRGMIDEVRIWDEALTANQIEVSYELGTGIQITKELSDTDANLGDHVTVTLDVLVAGELPVDVDVDDSLPDALSYIPGTFEVNGNPATPTVDGQQVFYELTTALGIYTITFDVQVVEVQYEDVDRTNWAYLYDGEDELDRDDADITLHPYAGFVKTFTIVYEENDTTGAGQIEVNELVQWDMTITVPNNVGWDITDAVLKDNLGGELGMAGDDVDNDRDVDIDEDDGTSTWGDLDGDYNTIVGGGTLDITTKGKTNKVQFKITGIDIGASDPALVFVLGIFTDYNPGKGKTSGIHSYSSDGTYDLNSGATLKFTDPDTGFLLSAHTCSIEVEVVPPIPLEP